MYKIKIEVSSSFGNIGDSNKFSVSEIKYVTNFEKIKSSVFKIKGSCTDLIKFLNLHVIGEDYHVPNTDYTIKFRDISQLDGLPCFELTSGEDLDYMFNTLEVEIKKNGISSCVGLVHKFKQVWIETARNFGRNYEINVGGEDEAKFFDVGEINFLLRNMEDSHDLVSVISEDGGEFENDGDSEEFIKKIRREFRIKNILNKDI